MAKAGKVTQLAKDPAPKKAAKPKADLRALSRKAHDALANGDTKTYADCKDQAAKAKALLLTRDELDHGS